MDSRSRNTGNPYPLTGTAHIVTPFESYSITGPTSPIECGHGQVSNGSLCVDTEEQTYLKESLHWNGTAMGCDISSDSEFLTSAYLITKIPEPIVTLNYSSVTNSLRMMVTCKYLPEDLAYVIRFSGFDPIVDQINIPSSCENRRSGDYGMDFDSFWSHWPNLNVPGTPMPNYLGLNKWNVQFPDCGTVQYMAKFSYEELQSCTDPRGNFEVKRNDAQANTVLSGSLIVSAVSPKYLDGDHGGFKSYVAQQWSHPFRMEVSPKFTATVQYRTSGENFDASIYLVKIDSDGYLNIGLQTALIPSGYGSVSMVYTPDYVPQEGGGCLSGTYNCGDGAAYQTLHFHSVLVFCLITSL